MRSFILAGVFAIVFLGYVGARFYCGINFALGCEDYLKRAADANSIELAQENLQIAVNYAAAHELTRGNTGILWQSPKNDVGFWYTNLTASLKNLKHVDPNASPLERSTVLIKLQQTLIDHTARGERVTRPDALGLFPHNMLFCMWGWVSGVLAVMIAIIGPAVFVGGKS